MVPSIKQAAFERVFLQLEGFEHSKHLIRSDLKIVKKNSIATWLGRIFTPQKYKASSVVRSLVKHINKYGRTGSIVRKTAKDTSVKEKKVVSLAKNKGLHHFLAALSGSANRNKSWKPSRLQHLANKLDKLLHSSCLYLDLPSVKREQLPDGEKLRGKVISLDLDKDTKPHDLEDCLDAVVRGYSEDKLQKFTLDQQAHQIYTTVRLVREIETDEKRKHDAREQGDERALSNSYARMKQKLRPECSLETGFGNSMEKFNAAFPFEFTAFKARVSRLSPSLVEHLQPQQRSKSI